MHSLVPPMSNLARSEAPLIAVIGAGSIGTAWAVVFASAGARVRLFESDKRMRGDALTRVATTLADLREAGILQEPAADILSRVTIADSLASAVADVAHVQECVVEDVSVKREIFAELDALAPRSAVLASSTSTIMPSQFAAHVPGRDRCLVVHPANPPYVLRVSEIVPAAFTSALAVEQTRSLLHFAGLSPIVLNREIEGFAFNRLQGALLREAYCLVRDEIISPTDLDVLVREGLGRRWSVIGPFTTSELNTRGGLRRHAAMIGSVYARIALERAADDPWTPETIDYVAKEIADALPFRTWEENVRARDSAMIHLTALLQAFENPLAGKASKAANAST